jgi:iron complex transport system substrate-binding protein
VISLAPHITELLFEAGAGERIVGTVGYSDYPEPARKIPRIGSFNKFDYEAITVLNPDLIIAWHSGNPASQMRGIHALQVPVFYSEPKQLGDIAETIEDFGRLTGTMAIASRQAERFRNRLRALQQTYANRKPVRVFYQVWDQPLMTVNGEHIISAAIALCGGVNVFADMPVAAPHIDMESVLEKNPQVIIAGINQQRSDWLQQWKRWPDIDAVANSHVYGVNPDMMTRHTSRILTATGEVCDYIDKARQ